MSIASITLSEVRWPCGCGSGFEQALHSYCMTCGSSASDVVDWLPVMAACSSMQAVQQLMKVLLFRCEDAADFEHHVCSAECMAWDPAAQIPVGGSCRR